jgi:uncharacterized protein
MTQRAKSVMCPRCGDRVEWSAQSAFRPFCSERCKNIDFGAWANDEYRVASEVPLDPGEIDPGDK